MAGGVDLTAISTDFIRATCAAAIGSQNEVPRRSSKGSCLERRTWQEEWQEEVQEGEGGRWTVLLRFGSEVRSRYDETFSHESFPAASCQLQHTQDHHDESKGKRV